MGCSSHPTPDATAPPVQTLSHRKYSRLRSAVGYIGLGGQTSAKARNTLAVQRIDHEFAAPCNLSQKTAGNGRHKMLRAVLLFRQRAIYFPMVGKSFYVMHGLMQAAAKHHVDFLKTAANPQQGNAPATAASINRRVVLSRAGSSGKDGFNTSSTKWEGCTLDTAPGNGCRRPAPARLPAHCPCPERESPEAPPLRPGQPRQHTYGRPHETFDHQSVCCPRPSVDRLTAMSHLSNILFLSDHQAFCVPNGTLIQAKLKWITKIPKPRLKTKTNNTLFLKNFFCINICNGFILISKWQTNKSHLLNLSGTTLREETRPWNL